MSFHFCYIFDSNSRGDRGTLGQFSHNVLSRLYIILLCKCFMLSLDIPIDAMYKKSKVFCIHSWFPAGAENKKLKNVSQCAPDRGRLRHTRGKVGHRLDH